MSGFVTDIEQKSLENSYFRQVLFTGPHCQLVVMSIAPGDDIGMETHHGVDQFIRVEAGHAKSILNGEERELHAGDAVVIPSGTEHDIVNLSKEYPLKLYTVYSPPQHADGTVHKTKADAEEAEKAAHAH